MASKWETFSLPGFWDEMWVFINSGIWISQNSFIQILPGLHSNEIGFGHPPFIFICLAILYRIFGYSHAVPHVFSAFFGFLGVYGTYLLGSHLHNRRAGFISGLLLFFSPLYFSQSGLVSAEIFLTSLAVLYVYFFIIENKLGYIVTGICLALTKEPALAVFVSVLIYQILFESKRSDFWNRIKYHSIPLIILVLFLSLQGFITGHAIDNPALQQSIFSNDFTMSWFIPQLWHIFRLIFIDQWRFIPSTFILTFSILHYRRITNRTNCLFLFILCGFYGAFIFVYFLPRYILTVFPFIFVLAAQAIIVLERNRIATNFIVAILCILCLYTSYATPTDDDYGLEVTMSYADYVRANMDAAKYIEANFPEKKVYLCETKETLTDAKFGYVTKNLNFSSDDYEVATTPVLPYPEQFGCIDEIKSRGLLFDNIFTHGAVSFVVYVKPGIHRFQ